MQGQIVDPAALDAAINQQLLPILPWADKSEDEGQPAASTALAIIRERYTDEDDDAQPMCVLSSDDAFEMGWDLAIRSACVILANPIEDARTEMRACIDETRSALFEAICANARATRDARDAAANIPAGTTADAKHKTLDYHISRALESAGLSGPKADDEEDDVTAIVCYIISKSPSCASIRKLDWWRPVLAIVPPIMKLAEAISTSQESTELYAEVATELRDNLRSEVRDYKREQRLGRKQHTTPIMRDNAKKKGAA